MKLAFTLSTVAVSSLVSTIAWAHPQHASGGFFPGFAHPFTGLDHLLAMIAVGFWAAQLGARANWAVPSAFVAAMAAGAAMAFAGIAVPQLEPLVAVTVLALGLLVTFRAQVPVACAASLVAVFALFHGAAHVVEMSPSQSLLAYSVGFMLCTGLLHLSGILIALTVECRDAAMRLAAAPVALTGVWMLVSRMA